MGASALAATGQKLTDIPPIDLAYIGGLFDGEGCILADKGPRISLTSCWPHHLIWISNQFGYGKFRQLNSRHGPRRTAFRWEASGGNAVDFLTRIRPYLKEKAYQADILLELIGYETSTLKHTRLQETLKSHKRIDYGPA
jgi:hypothetical protein